LREKGAWAYPGTAQIFFQYPLLSQEPVELRTLNLAGIFTASMRNKSRLKIWEKMERGCIQGLPKFFWLPPIISGTDKATNFKFITYIHRVHPNKSPLKIWENKERERIEGLPKFLKYPLLSQGWVKLRTSNLADIFRGSIRTKAN